MKTTIVAFFAILIVASLACSQTTNNNIIENVEAAKFKELVDSGKGIILDVRTPKEVAKGHIEGATAVNVSDNSFESKIDVMQKDKPIYVYCFSGSRSMKAAKIMQQKGFKKIYNLNGGILKWQQANYPLKESAIKTADSGPQYTTESFGTLITSDKLVLIDFHAVWCAPCIKMEPTIVKLTNDFKNKAKIVKIDIERNKEIANKYQVAAVPTFVLFKNGEKIWQESGAKTYEELEEVIKKNM